MVVIVVIVAAMAPINIQYALGSGEFAFTLQPGKSYEIMNTSSSRVLFRLDHDRYDGLADYQSVLYDYIVYDESGKTDLRYKDTYGSFGISAGYRVRVTNHSSRALYFTVSDNADKLVIRETVVPAFYTFQLKPKVTYTIKNTSSQGFSIRSENSIEFDLSSYSYILNYWRDPYRYSRSFYVSPGESVKITVAGSYDKEFYIDYELAHSIAGIPAPPAGYLSYPEIFVMLDGKQLLFDVPAQSINNRTMVPFRGLFEALGASISWNGETQTVTATSGDTVIVLPIGSTKPTVNGQVVTIEQPCVVIDGRTFVPVRFVAESLGVNVSWASDTRTVYITS